MSDFPRVLRSSITKEIRIWRRNPQKLALVVLLPLLFWVAFNLLMGGVYSTGIDVALVVEEDNPGYYTNALIDVLGEPDEIPPSLRLSEMNAETADALFQNGDIQLVITIPNGFEQALANNESTSIHIRVNNAHEDMTKNLRMPVIRKLDIFYQTYLSSDAIADFDYVPLRPYTFPRLAYMGWTISIYSLMFAAIFIGGSAMTQEFENKTLDELTLSNNSPFAIYSGKLLSSILLSYVAAPILLLLTMFTHGVWPLGDIITFLLLTIPFVLFNSSLGLVLGAVFRNSVYMVPIAALGSIFYWITGGGIVPLLLLGEQFVIADSYLPISNVYRSLIHMFVYGQYTFVMNDFAVIAVFALPMLVIAPFLANRISQIDYSRRIEELRRRRSRVRE